MNQILVCEKLYVTRDMKIKKKFFKIELVLSVFLFCILSTYCIYAEYDRNKDEQVSKDILQKIDFQEVEPMQFENESVQINDDVIVVVLNTEFLEQEEISLNDVLIQPEMPETQKLMANDGTEYYTIGVINIPSISVNYPILSTYSNELLKISPCKFWGANPNQVGNFCIAGHNYRNSKFFSKVPTLKIGDIIEITDLAGETLIYEIYNKFEVVPEDISCTSQKTNGKKEITLITCTNDSKKRVIIKAREQI